MKQTEPLGERAIRMGLASQEAISAALAEQRSRSDKGKRVPLGSLLVDMGLLVPTQLVQLLADGPLSGFHLGEDAVRLAAQLPQLLPQEKRIILVTSARTGHGVSTVASQVALALVLMGERHVLVVDAHLRAPAQHQKFRVRQAPGLVEAIREPEKVNQCIAPTGLRGLDVLPAGSVSGDALSAIISNSCERLLKDLRERHSYIVVDVPPMLEHPEATLLASVADGILVVAMAGKSKRSELEEVSRVISGLGVKHLGVILARSSGVALAGKDA